MCIKTAINAQLKKINRVLNATKEISRSTALDGDVPASPEEMLEASE